MEMNSRIEQGQWHSSAAGTIMNLCRCLAVLAVIVGMPFSSMADPPLVYDVENTGTNCPPPPLPGLGGLRYVPPLPDPFEWADWSGRSTNFVDWECHRNEIRAQIENYEIGTKPAVPSQNVTASYTNGTLTVIVTVGTNTLTLSSPVMLPAGSGPFPAVIGMNSFSGSIPSSLFTNRNIAQIAYFHNQVTMYGAPSGNDPYYKLYGPALNVNNTGQYSAWAWGVSRIIDGLQLVTNTLPIDLHHICVTGCSYAGKMALFSGAFDERVALTIAQESGGGGATSWRYSQTEPDGTVEKISNTDYNWFATQMMQFGQNMVSYMPEDHHELMAMCAPRALYVTANPDYVWLSNPSCYICSRATQQAYTTLGIPDRFGFSIVGGHNHCTLPASQFPEVGAFLDKFLLGMTNANTSIATYPSSYGGLNYTRWTQWWGTGNPIFPDISIQIPASATEGDGTLVGQGQVAVVGTAGSDVTIYLTSNIPSKVSVPASVVIPAGQSNAVFDLTVYDNSLLDGDQVVAITATAPSLGTTKRAVITIHDNDTTTLTVTMPASASETAGTLVNAGSVSTGTNVAADVLITLTSSDPSRLLVPTNVVIGNGQTSVLFNVTLVDDNIVQGPTTVSVTAHVQNWVDGSASTTVLDDDLAGNYHFTFGPVPSPQLIGEPFHVTITSQDTTNGPLDYRLPVTLSAFTAGSATGTGSILNSPTAEASGNDAIDYSMGYSFTPSTNLCVTHVRSYVGDKVSIWTAGGQLVVTQNVVSVQGTWVETPLPSPVVLLSGYTYVIAAHVPADYFYSVDLPAAFPNGTIDQSLWDYGNVLPTQVDGTQWYFVDLRYAPVAVVSIPVNPGTSGTFSGSTWSGNIAVLQPGNNVVLQASVGPGYSFGLSNPFNVLATPKLSITTLSNSVVISWPVAAAGFNLEQAPDLASWSIVPGTPATIGDRYYVTNGIAGGHTYFRLHKP
jgi:hypothetical protein